MQRNTHTLRPLTAFLKHALHSRAIKRTALGLGALAPAFAFANPTGGVVVAGQAGITAPDANHSIINQASQSAIINWQQFSIGSNQYVQFIQPDSSAVVLNRVIGGNASQILGNLSANGQVFLVNPNGVFFGQGATLDVQGLVATTMDIKDSDFMAGHYVFAKGAGAPDAGVVNQGTLTAKGGYVVLAGDQIENDGLIEAQAGKVVLAAGAQMALTLDNDALVSFVVDQATLAQYAGVTNAGNIEADGGTVLMTAKVANALTATAVNNSGLVTAHSIQDHNGTIILAAQGGDIAESGTLDASASESGVTGGAVMIRGNGHTEIASTANINAVGNNADGGFVELSGHTLSVRGNVAVGRGGELLLDPAKININKSSGASYSPSVGTVTIHASKISSYLNAGSNVTLVASSAIGISAGASNISATGTGNLKMEIGTTGVGASCGFGAVCHAVGGAPTITPGNGSINLVGITINIAGGFTAAAGSGPMMLGAVTAKNITLTAGYLNTGNLTTTGASAAGIAITVTVPNASNGHIFTGALTTAGSGNVQLVEINNSTVGSMNTISAGAITAGGDVTISTSNPLLASALEGRISLSTVIGKSISVSATAKQGAIIDAVGFHAIGVGGVTLSANATGGPTASGGQINVGTGGIVADNGSVSITAHGGQDSGADVSVTGNIVAAGAVNIQTSYLGGLTGSGMTPSLSLAAVTGKSIMINAKGNAPGITVGALTAKGTGTGSNVSVAIQNATSGNATAGFIKVNGAVKSSHGGVTLHAGSAHLKLGASSAAINDISAAGNVYVQGHDILLGNVTAGAGGSVNIEADTNIAYTSNASVKVASGKVLKGQSVTVGVNNNNGVAQGGSIHIGDVISTGTSSPYGIVVSGQGHATPSAAQIVNVTTGKLTGVGGRINVSDNAAGGTLTVNGAIQTGGTVGIFQSGTTGPTTLTTGNITGKSITVLATETTPNVTVGALTATGAATTNNVSVTLQDFSSAGVTAGYIHVNGTVKSSHGGVILNADRTSLTLGASSAAINDITAAGIVQLTAYDMLVGGISAGGLVSLVAQTNTNAHIKVASGKVIKGKSVSALVTGAGTAGGSLVLNDVTATGAGASGGITLGATNLGHPVTITAGNLTAATGDINVLAQSGGGTFTVNGAIKTGGTVNLQVSGVGSAQALGGINVSGSISAGGHVDVFEQGNFTGTNTLTLGNVTAATYLNVNATRQNAGSAVLAIGNISAPAIAVNETATSTSPAKITLGNLSAVNAVGQARVHVYANGKNDVITTGAITAQGKTANFTGSSSSSNSFRITNRTGAGVELFGSGSGAATVTVNGAINITAQGAGNYTLSKTGSHALTGSGSTGQAMLNVYVAGQPNNQGAIAVNGDITMSGAGGVDASLIAGKVNLGGKVTLTATAVHSKLTTVNTASGNNLTTITSAAQIGEALLYVKAGTATGLSASVAGSINVQGPAADVALNGANVKAGAVTVTGTGVKVKKTATGTSSKGAAVSFSSSRSAGFGALTAHATGPASNATVTLGGDVKVSGVGAADINVTGTIINTRNLTVTQTAGHYTAQGVLPGAGPSASFGGYWGNGLLALQQGTLTGGMALVSLQARGLSPCNCSNASIAKNVTVNGNIKVAAVGDGLVELAGSTVSVTGGISGTAAKATIANGKSNYTYTDSSSKTWNVAHTLSGSGGRMHVDILGKRGSGSFNGDDVYSGNATIGGDVTLTGPAAGIEVKSGNVTVKNVSVNASGNNLSVQDVYTPSGTGAAFTLSRSGIIEWTGVELAGKATTGVVTGGNLSVQGPLFAALHIAAGKVTLGNLNVNASSGSTTLLDTRLSSTPISFTAGDAGLAISTVSGAGTNVTIGPATVNGNITVQAAHDAHLLFNATVSGYTQVTAGRNIDDPLPANILRFLNNDVNSTSGSAGNLPVLSLATSALAFSAGGNIVLGDATFKVGSGVVSGVTGDSAALALIAGQGLSVPSGGPNASLVAGGTIGFGKFTLTGDYLYMQAAGYNLSGPVSVPTSTVVQFASATPSATIGIEPGSSTAEQINLSGALLNLFPGSTLMVGNTGSVGAVSIGSQGTITLNGGSNFLVNTQGTVTGLQNVLSTGLVVDLHAQLLQVLQVPTASEINTSNTGTTTDDAKKKTTVTEKVTGGSSTDDTIVHDDSTDSVCHG